MKVLLIIHGLVRPNLDSVLEIKRILMENFKEYECHTLLSTWFNDQGLDQDSKHYELDIDEIKSNFNYYLLDKQPTKNELLSQIKSLPSLDISKNSHLSNVYGYFHFYKKTNLIANLFQNYDYYVFCRSDLKIIVKDIKLQEFLLPKIFWKNVGKMDELNDHFFISNRDNFLKIFKELSIDNVNEFCYSHCPEKLFSEIIKRNINEFNFIENDCIKEYYLVREYRKWHQTDLDGVGRDSTQTSIDRSLNIKQIFIDDSIKRFKNN
jgi:hypothetical protein